jgi:hypothetical protein
MIHHGQLVKIYILATLVDSARENTQRLGLREKKMRGIPLRFAS